MIYLCVCMIHLLFGLYFEVFLKGVGIFDDFLMCFHYKLIYVDFLKSNTHHCIISIVTESYVKVGDG